MSTILKSIDNNFSKNEEEILQFWEDNKCFENSINSNNKFTLYEGPVFATGSPHYGHLLVATVKDIIARYQTMNGKSVERKMSYDCHGLPIEKLVEKKLGITSKQQITNIKLFNDECRNSISTCTPDWKNTITRLGRWIDFDNNIKTCDTNYMESVWWAFNQLWNKGLIYEGYKIMPYSIGCETELSNSEASLDYREVSDLSVIVKFKTSDYYLLVWTTTPWTLFSNLALCINPKLTYVKVKVNNEIYILQKNCLSILECKYEMLNEFEGTLLIGTEYQPLFNYFQKSHKKHYTILADEYVKNDSGTGIVHLAPGFGEDDHRICLEYGLISKDGENIFIPIDSTGKYTFEITKYQGRYIKDCDIDIAGELKDNNKLFRKFKIKHNYPYCWRSATPLIYRAMKSWFVNMEKVKNDLVQNNQDINWIPEHIKTGRFGNWISNAKDWSISRSRFWGTPLPLWKSKDGDIISVGSITELAKLSGIKVTDLHRETIDNIIIMKNGKIYHNIKTMLDCWFESGCYSFAHLHYPFENKSKFNETYPADFICESSDQCRGWFYTMNIISTILFKQPAFKNVICTGLILAEDGQKMSKSLNNYTDPNILLNKYGADALRLYLIDSPVIKAETLAFSDNGVYNIIKEVFLQWINAYKLFNEQYTLFVKRENKLCNNNNLGIVEQWIMYKFNEFTNQVNDSLKNYNLYGIVSKFKNFIETFCNWYIRLNRKYIRGFGDLNQWNNSLYTLYTILFNLAIIMAPLTPFLSEMMYQQLNTLSTNNILSVHHYQYKDVLTKVKSFNRTFREFDDIQRVINLIRLIRSKNNITLRKPIKKVIIAHDIDMIERLKIVDNYIKEESYTLQIEYMDKNQLFTKELLPMMRNIGREFKKDAKKVAELIKEMSNNQINELLNKKVIKLDKFEVKIEHVNIIPKVKLINNYENILEENEDPFVLYIDKNEDELVNELYLMGLLCTRIQEMRKNAALQPWNKIKIYYKSSPLDEIIIKHNKMIIDRLRCNFTKLSDTKSMIITEKELNIENNKIFILIYND